MSRRGHVIKANHHSRVPMRMVWVDTEAANEHGQMGPGPHAIETRQVRHARGQAALLLGHQLQPIGLVLALDEAGDVEAPGLLVPGREA